MTAEVTHAELVAELRRELEAERVAHDATHAALTALRDRLKAGAGAPGATSPAGLGRALVDDLDAILAGNAPAGTAVVDRDVYADIRVERARQDAKWGGPGHDEQHSADVWASLIAKHARRAVGAKWQDFRKHMVRAAALAVAAAETVDRVPKAAVYADTYPERESIELHVLLPHVGAGDMFNAFGRRIKTQDAPPPPPPVVPAACKTTGGVTLPVPRQTPHGRVCPRCSGAWRGGGRERGGSEDGKR